MQQKKAEDLNEKVLKVFSIQKYFKFHVGLSCAYRIDFCFSAETISIFCVIVCHLVTFPN